jgi:hypothetical protein
MIRMQMTYKNMGNPHIGKLVPYQLKLGCFAAIEQEIIVADNK